MPRCGSLPVPPGSVEREISPGLCIIAPAWSPLATQPLYTQGQFTSTNPNALVTRQFTDATGRVDQELFLASTGYLGTVCLSDCGEGTGFFGLGGQAADYGRLAAGVLSQIAIAASPFAPAYALGTALTQNVERSQEGMSLNLSGILGATGSILSGANLGDYSVFGQLAGAGLNIAGAALAPTPTYQAPAYFGPVMPVAAPVYGPPAVSGPSPQAQPVGAFGVAGRAIMAVTAPILAKIAVKLGLRARPSLTRAMEMIRKTAKLLQSPEAVAAALGITVAEMASLIVASNSRKRRRMNPANSKALRRAARRIKSFHRLCTHTDVLKGRSRRSPAYAGRGACATCKKSPCRC